jgi:uncharacterized coiled-coil protein SlyX
VLGLSIRQAAKIAGFSEGLWRQLESGVRVLRKGVEETVSPKQSTLMGACRALGWSPHSIDLILAGEEPEVVSVSLQSVEIDALRDQLLEQAQLIERLSRQMGAALAFLDLDAEKAASDGSPSIQGLDEQDPDGR